MRARTHNITAESPMEIAEQSRTPVLRRGLRDAQLTFTKLLPPFQLVNCAESKPPNDVADILRHNNLRSPSAAPTRKPRDGPQRWPMEMIEMRMAHEYVVDWWKIAETNTGPPLSLQHDQPASEIGIDHQVRSTNLNEKSAMSNK